ncbi:terminase small subunit, partial [Salmonella enterica subsp. salamae serovar 42:b:e,n,x,z15]
HLKTLVAKGANQCAKAGDKLPELLDEYIRTENE